MFTQIKLENFKSWQSLDIELAPVTILFGTNSSGKSSILQSILFLIQSSGLRQQLDFGGRKSSYVDLGSYAETVFQHNLKKNILISVDTTWNNQNHNRKIGFKLHYESDNTQSENLGMYKSIDGLFKFTSDASYNGTFQYLGPLRQHPERTYLWEGVSPRMIEANGQNTIAALIESIRKKNSLTDEVSKWLIEMGLITGLRVESLGDEGNFYKAVIKSNGVESLLPDTGFGISQVLPVVTMLFFAPEGSIILLEQPELHLHPRAQAHLADLMLHVAKERNLQLIVESHSEHLLRRLQRRIAEVENEFASPENVKMYFCDTGDNGSTIQDVKVDEFGQIQNWPDKFFGDITGDLEAMTMAALQRSMNGKD